MNEIARHRMVYKLLVNPVKLFLKWRFGYQWDDLREIEGPYLLLANHNLELDPALVGVAAGKQLYFVASEHLSRKGFVTKLLMRYFKPIIHMKGKKGIQTIKQMLKTLHDGHSVCIFPEGNRSFNGLTGDILPAIGKVAKRSGARLITYRIEGGFLTQPRFSATLRKGYLRGRLIGSYSSEELSAMTDEQVNQLILNDLSEDAYQTQEKVHSAYKGKKLALGLESTVFACPECRKIGTLYSDSERLHCECGFSAVYDAYGYLTDTAGNKYTVTELDTLQRKILEEKYAGSAENDMLFGDKAEVHLIGADHTLLKTQESELIACREEIECCGRRIPYDQISGMAIYSRNCLIIHVQGEEGHMEIKGGKYSFCALKYLYLYQMKQGGKGD